MKNYLLYLGIGLMTLACTKDENANINKESTTSGKIEAKNIIDPVLAYYSDFGKVQKMSSSYVGQSSYVCSNHLGIYQFTPSAGPYKDLICEIYRFKEAKDISASCDETYDLEQKEEQIGNIKYIHCSEDGSNCKTLEMPWGCSLVFCDETDVD